METPNPLERVAIFSQLEPSELQTLTKMVRRQIFQKGEVVFHENDPGDRVHFVVEGMVRISVSSPDGIEHDIAILTPGDCFGEMSVLDGELRSATAVTMEPTATLTLARDDFLAYLHENTQFAIQIIAFLVGRLRATNGLVGDIVFLDLPSRVAKKMLEVAHKYDDRRTPSGHLTVPMGQEEISRLVGCSRETVAKVVQKWRKTGLLTTSRRRIEIANLEELERIAAI